MPELSKNATRSDLSVVILEPISTLKRSRVTISIGNSNGTMTNPQASQYETRSEYREYYVPKELAEHFLCLWTQTITGSRSEYVHRVLPDACVDIIFINHDPPSVVGPWTDPFLVRFIPGTTVVGARLHPGRAPSLLGVPATELLNDSVALSAVWGSRLGALFAQVADSTSPAARRLALCELLIQRVSSFRSYDRMVVSAMRWLGRHPHGTVEQLGQDMGISNRQLQRRFCAAVGYGPKLFHSVLRFQRLLQLSGGAAGWRSLADLAAAAGYADQAHMTREVQRFSHCPPTALLRSTECTLRMSDLFKTSGPVPA
jgi:AraC-like DNA-binding protein